MDTAPLISNPLKDKINKNSKILLVTPKNLPNLYNDITEFYNNSNIQIVADEKDQIFNAIESCSALIGCPRNIFSDELLDKGKNLSWIHSPGAGIEHFLSEKFIKSDIIFTNGKKIQGPECADHAMALILTLTRNIKLSIKGLEGKLMPRPIELLEKKALVVGLGGIGMCLAERLKSFGVEVIGIDNEYKEILSFLKKIYDPSKLIDIVSEMDMVFCCAPLTYLTNKMFNKKVFNAFKKNSYFVNVSRGGCVDTDALIFAIENKKLSGAGIDVLDPEPFPKDHKIFNFENIIITNHIAGLSDKNRERSVELIKKNIGRFLESKELINIVDKFKGY